jgi:putative ABC transport system substrate-binding protein
MAAGDPIVVGLVNSLAQPGGNVTGLSTMTFELGGKRLELLKEILPRLSSAGVLWDPDDQFSMLQWKEIQLPAKKLGIQLHSLEIRSSNDIDRAFEHANKVHAGALVIVPHPVFATNLKRIAALAAKNGLPSVFHLREFVIAGGLLAYGPDRADMFRRAATYVDKILKGAKPADLPVEQPTKFELFINGKTAKALGLAIPQSLLIRADKVIE